VQIVTLHKSKGLEYPLVFLPFVGIGGKPPDPGRHCAVHDADAGRRLHWKFETLPEAGWQDASAAWKREQQAEDARLLYVGLTRAAERLIITGVRPSRGEVVGNSWHSRTATALVALGGLAQIGPWGEGLSWHGTTAPRAARQRAGRRPLDSVTLPDWARAQAPQEERPPRPLSPSSIGPDCDAMPPPSPALRAAAERGTLLHGLFERLPAVAPAERRAAALAWLARSGVVDANRAGEIMDAALAVIDDPRFADLFAPDALAEAPIAATLSDGRVIAGTVDRLCIGADLVRVIDFKTGRLVPSSADALPPGHVAQMQAYADALGVIFPGRRVEASLLYTQGPTLIALGA
jgi:ATP-dependent helicase/nuclease subunit A